MAYQKGPPNTAWKAESVYKGGGRFWDLGAHLVDQLLILFPNLTVTSVYCRMMFDFESMNEADSHAHLTVVFNDGTTGIIDTNSTTAIEKPRFYVVGDLGTFEKHGVDPQEDAMLKKNIDSSEEDKKLYGRILWRDKNKERVTVETLKGRWRSFYENVSDVLHDPQNHKQFVSLASVRRAVCVMNAALESVKLGRSLSVSI